MKSLKDTAHLLRGTRWEPGGNPAASTDAIIALTHVDVAAPSFGIGTCWAGFVAMRDSLARPAAISATPCSIKPLIPLQLIEIYFNLVPITYAHPAIDRLEQEADQLER
jgi:nitroreductase